MIDKDRHLITSILLLAAMLTCVGGAGATDWHANAGESVQDAIDDAEDGDIYDGTIFFVAESDS